MLPESVLQDGGTPTQVRVQRRRSHLRRTVAKYALPNCSVTLTELFMHTHPRTADTRALKHTHRQDARMGAITSSNGIDDILKRAMGNRKAMFKRT